MILGIRTDKPEAELYLYNVDGSIRDSITWTADRQLSETILSKIDTLLQANNATKTELTGLVVYQGPGSFTGLRIGLSVANTLAFSLNLPIAGAPDDDWQAQALTELQAVQQPHVIIPLYGSEPHITQPRK